MTPIRPMLIGLTVLVLCLRYESSQRVYERAFYPTQLDFIDSVPDSVKTSIRTIFQLSKVELVTAERMKELSSGESRTVFVERVPSGSRPGSTTAPSPPPRAAVSNLVLIDFQFTDPATNQFILSYKMIPVPPSKSSDPKKFKSHEVDAKVYSHLDWPHSLRSATEELIKKEKL